MGASHILFQYQRYSTRDQIMSSSNINSHKLVASFLSYLVTGGLLSLFYVTSTAMRVSQKYKRAKLNELRYSLLCVPI